MTDRGRSRFERQLENIRRRLPGPLAAHFGRVLHPSARWVRVPLGLGFIVAGVFGFLPVLGFWMIPLGLLLLARDIPFLRGPTGRLLVRLQGLSRRWKRRSSEG